MFNFLKKTVNTENIKDVNWALAAIDLYIYLEEWENAKNSIKEVEIKEKSHFQQESKKNKSNPTILNKLWENYNRNIIRIEKLKKKYKDKKANFEEKNKKKIFNLKIKKITEEIEKSLSTGNTKEALEILDDFLSEYREIPIVVTFYAKEKKKILKEEQKQKEKEEKKRKEKWWENEEAEALRLIWKTVKVDEIKKEDEGYKELSFFWKILNTLTFYRRLKDRLEKKRLLDEVRILIDEENKIKEDLAIKKLENIHKWLVKELLKSNLIWYDIYWKVLWRDKISWDAVNFSETKKQYCFFLWDATWHWVRAGLIISLLNKHFKDLSWSDKFRDIVFRINNNLKAKLESRNFVTWIFFRINKRNTNAIDFIWMWHEPMLLYKNDEKKVEQIIPWWLAMWIRKLKWIDDIPVKSMELWDKDIILTYSDWVTETKDKDGNFYWLERLKETFLNAARSRNEDMVWLYNYILEDLWNFKWWTNFTDDTTILMVKRDKNKDIVEKNSEDFSNIIEKEWLSSSESKRLVWKNKEWMLDEINRIKKEKETKHLIEILEHLYLTWEILKLKEEATRFIKDWFIDKKINFYLKKALENENNYKVNLKNQKILHKYNTLLALYKSWNFDSVIEECQNVIIKNGDI